MSHSNMKRMAMIRCQVSPSLSDMSRVSSGCLNNRHYKQHKGATICAFIFCRVSPPTLPHPAYSFPLNLFQIITATLNLHDYEKNKHPLLGFHRALRTGDASIRYSKRDGNLRLA